MRRRLRTTALVLGLLLVAATPALAEETWSYSLSSELMSPYCPGRTLTDCPSGQAEQLREWITAQEQAGRSREQVVDELYARFGDVLRQAPAARGIGLAAYAVPILLFVAGGALVAAFLRRQSAAAPPEAPQRTPAPEDPELERRLDDEISRGREAG